MRNVQVGIGVTWVKDLYLTAAEREEIHQRYEGKWGESTTDVLTRCFLLKASWFRCCGALFVFIIIRIWRTLMHFSHMVVCLPCSAESSLCDRGASLSQLWGFLHSSGSHHRSRGQRQPTFAWWPAVCYFCSLCMNSSRLALCHWWSFPMWASCLEAGPQSCGTTSWPMSRGWADTVMKC